MQPMYFNNQGLGVLVGIEMVRGTDEVKSPLFLFFFFNVPSSWPSHLFSYKVLQINYSKIHYVQVLCQALEKQKY